MLSIHLHLCSVIKVTAKAKAKQDPTTVNSSSKIHLHSSPKIFYMCHVPKPKAKNRGTNFAVRIKFQQIQYWSKLV